MKKLRYVKSKKVFNYIFMGWLSLMGLMAGFSKLLATDTMVANMASLGHGIGFVRFLGGAWIVLIASLWFKPTRIISAFFISLILSGAISAHLTAGQGIGEAMNAIMLLVVVIIVMLLNDAFIKLCRT